MSPLGVELLSPLLGDVHHCSDDGIIFGWIFLVHQMRLGRGGQRNGPQLKAVGDEAEATPQA